MKSRRRKKKKKKSNKMKYGKTKKPNPTIPQHGEVEVAGKRGKRATQKATRNKLMTTSTITESRKSA